ncbi:uncharacterized protein LOC135093075 isoform X2 [Scylla paramamosain]|uniref:uncharacterized protein LOC135093075 isoform X2 n=1 Tax=Scylla paramamosain TaxID=85552 RepID=UPI0030829FBB
MCVCVSACLSTHLPVYTSARLHTCSSAHLPAILTPSVDLQMEGPFPTLRARRKRAWLTSTYAWALLLGVWAAWGAGEVRAAPHPRPDSDSSDTPEADPSSPQQGPSAPSSVVVAGGRGSTAEDIMNHYLPVIMAEMEAPVSTRDPSIIRVAGCRPGFNEDPLGTCRPVFVPRAYLPRTTRPNRQTNIASLLPVRPRPRVSRPQPQTQRDLIRQFNTSRRRQAWFGRSLSPPRPPPSCRRGGHYYRKWGARI